MGRQLGDVFDFDVFPFKTWRWIIFDGLKHDPVELRCFYFLSPVCIYLQGSLQYSFNNRCLVRAEAKMISTSLNGAIFFTQAFFVFDQCFPVFSTRSHLLTTITTPFRFLSIRWKILRSWASIPRVASIRSITHPILRWHGSNA